MAANAFLSMQVLFKSSESLNRGIKVQLIPKKVQFYVEGIMR